MANNSDELNNRFKTSAEDFSLAPSPATWEKIEREIAGRDRKKRFLIFFLLGGLLLPGSVVIVMNVMGKRDAAVLTNNGPIVLTRPSTLQGEKQHSQVNSNVTGSSSAQQDNGTAVPDQEKRPGKNLTTGKGSFSTVAPGKSSGPVLDPPFPKNQEQHNTHSNEMELKKIISPALNTDITTAINIPDSLRTKPTHDSLPVVRAVALVEDSMPGKKDTAGEIPFVRTWSFTGGGAIASSFTKFSERGDYQFVAHYRDSSGQDLLAPNLHFNIAYHVFPRVELFTGIGLVNYRERMLNNQVVYRDDTLPVSGPLPPVIVTGKGYYHINGDTMGTTNTILYLQIPLGIRYNVLSFRKCELGIQPEISFNKAIYTKGYMYAHAAREYKTTGLRDLRSLNFGYGIGISFRYELRKNLQLELMPYFFGMQRSIFASSPLSQKFQQAEARVSLRYIFPE